MENPSELIRKAKANRLRRESRTRPAEVENAGGRPAPPVSRHGAYTELMRSHDRISTRHIGKQN